MKRLICIILLIAVLLSTACIYAGAFSEVDSHTNLSSQKDKILQHYQEQIQEARIRNSLISASSGTKTSITDLSAQVEKIQSEAVSELRQAGYWAYDINPRTYESLEEELGTDFQSAGLSPDGTYLVLIEGDLSETNSRQTTSPSFTHVYDGTTYTMRWLTVFASDDPRMIKESYVNILDSKSRSVIEHCLNAAFDIYVGAISDTLGIVKSILGLDISDFMDNQNAYYNFNAASTWTRRYTQVWDSYQQMWFSCCCVEEVSAASYLNGWHYDVTTNSSQPDLEYFETKYYYSDYFYDYEWRKDTAAAYFYNYAICWDVTDDVTYKYDGRTVIRHVSNF